MLTESWLNIGGLQEGMDEAHFAVEQRAGFHEVMHHLLSTDSAITKKNRGQELLFL